MSIFDSTFTEIRFPVTSGKDEASFVRGILEGKGIHTISGDMPSLWMIGKRRHYALVKVEAENSPLAEKIISEYLRSRPKPQPRFVNRATAFLTRPL